MSSAVRILIVMVSLIISGVVYASSEKQNTQGIKLSSDDIDRVQSEQRAKKALGLEDQREKRNKSNTPTYSSTKIEVPENLSEQDKVIYEDLKTLEKEGQFSSGRSDDELDENDKRRIIQKKEVYKLPRFMG